MHNRPQCKEQRWSQWASRTPSRARSERLESPGHRARKERSLPCAELALACYVTVNAPVLTSTAGPTIVIIAPCPLLM